MKKSKLFTLAVIALTCIFTSCGKDNLDTPVYELRIIEFEKATLNADGILLGEEYQENGITFNQYYKWIDEDEWGYKDYYEWNGFAVSNNKDKDTEGYVNQFSIYEDEGCNGSSNFAVCYVTTDNTAACGTISFDGDNEYEMEYAYITNSTYAYYALKKGDSFATTFTDGDYFVLTATGYKANGTKTADVDFYLADFRKGKTNICTAWTKFNLISLGKVNKVVFTLSSTDNGEYGMNTPAYFCIDDVAYREYLELE